MNGIEEDDGYSDDELDELPVNDFHELQQEAIRSTQQPQLVGRSYHPHGNYNATSNTRQSAHDELSVDDNCTSYPHQPSSDYGDFDDEMLDGEIFDAAAPPSILREQNNTGKVPDGSAPWGPWPQPGHSRPSADTGHPNLYEVSAGRPATHVQTAEQRQSRDTALLSSSQKPRNQGLTKPTESPTHLDELQTKINELLRANEQLRRESDAAKSEALSKTGEISIVRANRLKEKQEEERRLATERKLRADEQAKYNAEIGRYKTELQKLATDKAFVDNDIAREAEQRKGAAKAQKAAAKSKASGKENTATTPKKNKDLPYGDGFNEDEIQAASPSKLVLRSKPLTPKAGAKRKRRPMENSPIKPLQLSQANNVQHTTQPKEQLGHESSSESVQVPEDNSPRSILALQTLQDERFELTQRILDHRLSHDDRRSIEALSDFFLPSQPEKTISSLFLDGLSSHGRTPKVENLAVTVGLNAISLWSQCLDATLYRPVVLLMDLVRFILTISPSDTAPHFTDELTVLVQRTADLNLIPRIRRKPPPKLTAELETKLCLEILHLMAYGCLWQLEDLERFWRCVRVDFIAMALKVDQPINEIHIALDLLRASVLENTFAMIRSAADGDQETSEQGLIQIMSTLFVEAPRVLEGRKPYDVTEIARLRLGVLSLMEKMCETEHGGEALAKCVNVFVRLIRLMNDEIASLYDYRHGHEYRIELINESMRLLYYITTTYPHLINIQERLATIPGGAHKYLIVLTRLNFSDDTYYEQGIEDDVVECAQHMLENWVTPEEGEALVEAFSSARK